MASAAPATRGLLGEFERVEPGGLRLLRAWPRDETRAGFEYAAPDGSRVAAQWRADPAELQRVAAATSRGAPAGAVTMAPPVLLQAGGADRRLPSLSALAGLPGAELLTHRPERRGVVRLPDGSYAKVLPQGRVPAVARTAALARELAGDDFAVAAPLSRPDGDSLVFSPLSGVSLHELLERGGPGASAAVAATGRALRAFHSRTAPAGLDHHGPAEDAAVVRMWLQRTAAWVPETASRVAPLLAELEAQLTGDAAGPRVPVHRDLHDKQVLIGPGRSVGILDFDLLAAGEPALDLANLLVHLELRALQGSGPPGLGATLLDAYDPAPAVQRRLAPYADAVRLRLACVYAMRPRSRNVVEPLLAGVSAPAP